MENFEVILRKDLHQFLKEKAGICGYVTEVVAEGEHYDYLARITKKT